MSWASRGNGPDMRDLAATVEALEKMHDCSIYLLLLTAGSGVGLRWHVLCNATKKGWENEQGSATIGAGIEFPNRDNSTIEGCIMNLLYSLDHLLVKEWGQEGLPLPEHF